MKAFERSLALAAGGACGAYHAGALLALAEHAITFDMVSGTSVGTLNGAYYIQSDGSATSMRQLCGLWREIATIGIVKVQAESFFSKFKTNLQSVLDPQPLRDVLDKHLNYDSICRSSKRLVITTIPSIDPLFDVLSGAFQKPVYFFAEELTGEDLRNALFAATAIPFAFPSVSVKGNFFSDAGLGTPLPSTVLYKLGSKAIVSIFLSDTHIQNRLDYPNAVLFQVRPSENIFTELLSMLDFSPKKINHLIDLGYSDTQRYIKEVSAISDGLKNLSENRSSLDELMKKLPNP